MSVNNTGQLRQTLVTDNENLIFKAMNTKTEAYLATSYQCLGHFMVEQ